MPTSLRSFLILIVLFGMLFGYRWYSHTYNPATLTGDALNPDIYLDNAKLYAKDHSYERGVSQLEDAIKAIRKIEESLDDKSTATLEGTIKDLEVVLEEFRNEDVIQEDLNAAFSKALNALTIAELRVSEFLLDSEHSDQAMVALKYGMFHLKNALKFTAGHKKDYEAHIYDEIDSLLEDHSVDHETMINRLEFMIAELDSLVTDQISE